MKKLLKQNLGKCLVPLAESLPAMRKSLRDAGLRTTEGTFGNRKVTIHLKNGRKFHLTNVDDNYLTFQLFWRGGDYYEPITRMVLEQLIDPNTVFFDVGANVGFFSVALGAQVPGLRVISFEPNPKNFAILKENTEANGLATATCESMALSDKSGSATLYLSESDMSASLVNSFQPQYTKQTGTVTVQSCSLDDYVRETNTSGRLVLKVDVEGHESAFFAGAWKTISQFKPDIVTEVLFEDEPSFAAELRQMGYRCYHVTNEGLIETNILIFKSRPPFTFLNCLLTCREKSQVEAVFNRIKPAVQELDLFDTSKYFPERQDQPLNGTPVEA